MPTGIQVSGSILVGTQKPTDARYGPYASTSAALSDLTPVYRYKGLTVGIEGLGGVIAEYWFNDGIADEDFVPKAPLTGSGGIPLSGIATTTGSPVLTTDDRVLYNANGETVATFATNFDLRKPLEFGGTSGAANAATSRANLGAAPNDIVSDTAPASGVAGQRWVNTALGRSFDWIDGAWVETGGGGAAAVSPHKSTHATGGSDALTPADIGAAYSTYEFEGLTINGQAPSANVQLLPKRNRLLDVSRYQSNTGTNPRIILPQEALPGDVIVIRAGTILSAIDVEIPSNGVQLTLDTSSPGSETQVQRIYRYVFNGRSTGPNGPIDRWIQDQMAQRPTYHTHAIADTSGLQTALDGKASTSHKSTHAIDGSDALTPADIGAVAKSGDTMTGKLNLPASTTSGSSLNIAQGADPSSPAFGDIWATPAGIRTRTGFISSPVTTTLAALERSQTFTHPQTINAGSTAGLVFSVTNSVSIPNLPNRAAEFIANGTAPVVTIVQNSDDLQAGAGLLIRNANGTGECLRIEDESPETTPFVVNASGRVGIGGAPDSTVGLKLDSTGVKFDDGTVQTTAAAAQQNADWDATSGVTQILNKPSTFAPSAHKSTHAIGGSDALTPSDIGAFGLKTYYSVTMQAGESSKMLTLPANETNIEVVAQALAVPSGTITINLPTPAPVGSLVTIYTDGWAANNRLIVQVVGATVIVNENFSNPQGSFNKVWYIQNKSSGWANITSDINIKSNWLADPGAKDEILNKPTIPALTNTAPANLAATAAVGTSSEAARADHVHARPTPADIGAATAAQGAKADTALQSGAAISAISGLQTALNGKLQINQEYFVGPRTGYIIGDTAGGDALKIFDTDTSQAVQMNHSRISLNDGSQIIFDSGLVDPASKALAVASYKTNFRNHIGAIGKNSSDVSPVSTIRCLTQGEYDALGTYDPQTLYFIK